MNSETALKRLLAKLDYLQEVCPPVFNMIWGKYMTFLYIERSQLHGAWESSCQENIIFFYYEFG